MILRRIAHHMKQQHWTGVFIELAIVVLGVFIGLQVDNWNQNRQDRGLERQYLERLRDDMQSSSKHAHSNIKFMHQQYQRDGKMLDELASCKLEGNDQAVIKDPVSMVDRNSDYHTVIREGIPSGRFSFDVASMCKNTRFASSIANVQQYVGVDIWQNENELTSFQNLVKIIDRDLATNE